MRPPESFVGQPVRSLQTMLRVLAEDGCPIPKVIPDGIYGPVTMNAVSAFQRLHGLPVTGVTDQATWDQIVTAYDAAIVRVGKAAPVEVIMNPNQSFRLGEESAYLYLMQSILTVLAKEYDCIQCPNHNGVLDECTAQALASFQHLAGLPETGELDKTTWKHMSNQFTLLANHQSQP